MHVSSVGLCSTHCTAAGASEGTGSAISADPLQISLQPMVLLQGPAPEPVHQGLLSLLQADGSVPHADPRHDQSHVAPKAPSQLTWDPSLPAGSAPSFAFPPATAPAFASGAVPPFGAGGAPAFGLGAAPAFGSGGATAGPTTAGGTEPEGEAEDTGANEPNVSSATADRSCDGPGRPAGGDSATPCC